VLHRAPPPAVLEPDSLCHNINRYGE
jgi:hypothetical protein